MPSNRDRRSAMIIVDMVVDSVTGFWPVWNSNKVTANVIAAREACYSAGVPVIQLQHTYRADGLDAPINEARDAHGTPYACVEGTAGAEFVEGLDPGDRDIVVRKHRWHGFFGTPLESVLHRLGAEQIIWAGVFTDACLSQSVNEGYHRDYPSVLIADACSCANEFTHKAAILTMANWVFDLTVFSTRNFERWISGDEAPQWYSGEHNTVPYASEEDVHRMYGDVLAGNREKSRSVASQTLA